MTHKSKCDNQYDITLQRNWNGEKIKILIKPSLETQLGHKFTAKT